MIPWSVTFSPRDRMARTSADCTDCAMSLESSVFARVARSARMRRRSEAERSVSAFSNEARRAAYRLLATFRVQVSIPESLRRWAPFLWLCPTGRACFCSRVRRA